MAQKRIKMVWVDSLVDKVSLLYDDGTQGELDLAKCRDPITQFDTLIGLTLKQAKRILRIKR